MRATFYVQVEPRWSRWQKRDDGSPALDTIKAVAMTLARPTRNRRGESVVVKLTVEIPDAAFYPLQPEAIVVIPAELVEPTKAIEVVASAPGGAS